MTAALAHDPAPDRVLRLIASQPNRDWTKTRRELASRLGLDPQVVAEIVQHLEAEGFVRRKPGARYGLTLVKEPAEADLEAEEALEEYKQDFLLCRDLRHAWDFNGQYWGSAGGRHRWLVCRRCGTERDDHEMHGVRYRTYRYPDGYQLVGAHVKPHHVHEEMTRRFPTHGSREELEVSKSKGKKRPG